jgi:hypothetical protein
LSWQTRIASDPLMLQAVGFDPAILEEGPIETLDTPGLVGASQAIAPVDANA